MDAGVSDPAWAWLGTVDPESVERERFNVTAKTLRRTEGTHLGFLAAVGESPEARRIVARGHMWSRVRSLEHELDRVKREHARDVAWHRKLLGRGVPALSHGGAK